MAQAGINVILGQALAEGKFVTSGSASNGLDSTIASKQATVAANVATLVADGASPTQAHVTTLAASWALLNTALATVSASNLSISFDTSVITSKNALRAALNEALRQVDGSSILP